MKTIKHDLNNGTGARVMCVVNGKNVSYRAAFGENVDGTWTTPLNPQFARQVLHENRKTLRSTVR